MKFGFEKPSAPTNKNPRETPDLSRRGFMFGKSRATTSSNVEQEDVSVEITAADEVSGSSGESDVITRRDVLMAGSHVAGGLVIGSVLGEGASKAKNFFDEAGGVEALKQLHEGVKSGKLAQFISENQFETYNQENLEKELAERTRAFQDKYHIALVFTENPHHKRSDNRATSSEAHLRSKWEAVLRLENAFEEYPFFMIENLHIPSITVRDSLKTDTGACDGFAFSGDHSIALNVNDNVWMALQGRKSLSGFGAAVHHELFHLLDPLLNEVSDSEMVYAKSVLKWPRDSKYLQDAWSQADFQGNRPAGFARDYGRHSMVEDRATVYEMMKKGVMKREIEADPVLLAKMHSIDEQIFFQSKGLLCFEFTDDYFRYSHRLMEDRAKQLVESDRRTLAIEYPNFAKVTDDEYRSWQEFHRSQLAQGKY